MNSSEKSILGNSVLLYSIAWAEKQVKFIAYIICV